MSYEDFYLSRDSEFSYVISSVFSVGVGGWRGERGGGGREAGGGGGGRASNPYRYSKYTLIPINETWEK